MKKWSISIVFLLVFLLSACGGKPNWEVEITQEPAFIEDKASQMNIEVTEDGAPLEGLEIAAELAMTDMDHGTVEANLEEVGEGIYAAKVDLPMAGKWEVVFNLKKDDQELVKVVEIEVAEAEGVASINGEWITDEDLEFYQFINTLHIEMGREVDRGKYTGAELEDAMKYWDTQQELNDSQNSLVGQIIRLRSMALLGEEKGHTATEEEINTEVEKARSQYAESDVAQELIAQYGEEKFWDYQKAQYEKIVLTQKVQNDVIELVKKDKPEASEQEIQFDAQKKYEELLVSQVDSLDIVLF